MSDEHYNCDNYDCEQCYPPQDYCERCDATDCGCETPEVIWSGAE